MSHLIEDWRHRKNAVLKKKPKWLPKLRQHRGKPLDRWAKELDTAVFKEIDCLDCANCCTSIPPIVTNNDAERLAAHLRISSTDFFDQYLQKDEDGDIVINQSPCPFLQEDNKCSVYEYRPKACRQYPHTGTNDFSKYLELHFQNSVYCPAVFHLLERMDKAGAF